MIVGLENQFSVFEGDRLTQVLLYCLIFISCFICRWILLCFKREFNEKEALRIWEACWSHYQTDYFHLFICVAIVSVYGEDVIEQCLPADEILLHFSSLACHMSGELVLRKVCSGLCLWYKC